MSNAATDRTNGAANPDLERILNDFTALKRDFAELIGHVRSGAVTGTGEALRSSIDALGDKTRGAYDELVAQGERSAKALGRQVEERPIASLLIAFGAGVLVSRLLLR